MALKLVALELDDGFGTIVKILIYSFSVKHSVYTLLNQVVMSYALEVWDLSLVL